MSVASSSDSTGNNNEDTQKDKTVGFYFFIQVWGIKLLSGFLTCVSIILSN